MKTKMKGKDFVTLMDYTEEELETIFEVALDLKRRAATGESQANLLPEKTLGMLFLQPSTRTRISFETAMTQLGGHAQYYSPEQLQLKNKEAWVDTASVMGRYLDGIILRTYGLEGPYGVGRQIIDTFAAHADVPVINACDDQEHPCQVMADILTVMEKFGPNYKKRKYVMCWVYAPRPKNLGIPQCTAIAAAKLGMNVTFAFPEGYEIDPVYMKNARQMAEESSATIDVVRNLAEAVQGADVIYAKSFGSHALSHEEDMSQRETLKDWIIKPEHFEKANKNAVFMHALPIDRNIEAREEVIDGPHSIIYDEAENRLHVQKAILSLVMG
jgi:ornithine carbamoyltransferase